MAIRIFDWGTKRFSIGPKPTELPTCTTFAGTNLAPKITVEKSYGAGDTHYGQGLGKKEWDNLTFEVGYNDVKNIKNDIFGGVWADMTRHLSPEEYITFSIDAIDDQTGDVIVSFKHLISRIISVTTTDSEGTSTDQRYVFECTIDKIEVVE